MKTAIQKLISIVASVVLVAMLVPAVALGAGETGAITLDNPQDGKTYTAYKVFDVTYNSDKSAFSYTIDSNSKWFDTVKDYDGVLLEQVNGGATYNVSKTDKFSAASFANLLKENVAGKDGTDLDDATVGGKAVKQLTGLDLGYYFVTTDAGALCNLTTTTPTADIHDKNDVPFEKKVDTPNVQIGDEVEYTIEGMVPDTTGFDEYTYEVTDTMDAGLTFKKDVQVTIGGEVADASNYTLKYDVDSNANKFTLSIDVKKYTFGQPIVIKYHATINENAAGTVQNNTATLKYSNDPTDSSKTTTIDKKAPVYSAKIVIDKVDGANNTTKLAGAKFYLMDGNGAGAKYYKYTAASGNTPAKVDWVDSKDQATPYITDDKGAAEFKGLENGTYYLLEDEAPAGYNLLSAPVKVDINGNETDPMTLTVGTQVKNNTGSQLPSTGGIGTTIFYVGGAILIVGALIALIVKRRSAKHSA